MRYQMTAISYDNKHASWTNATVSRQFQYIYSIIYSWYTEPLTGKQNS